MLKRMRPSSSTCAHQHACLRLANGAALAELPLFFAIPMLEPSVPEVGLKAWRRNAAPGRGTSTPHMQQRYRERRAPHRGTLREWPRGEGRKTGPRERPLLTSQSGWISSLPAIFPRIKAIAFPVHRACPPILTGKLAQRLLPPLVKRLGPPSAPLAVSPPLNNGHRLHISSQRKLLPTT